MLALGGTFAGLGRSKPWSSSLSADDILLSPNFPPDFPLTKADLSRLDEASDGVFYTQPRLLHHIDDYARARLKRHHAEVLPKGGVVVDLMSSWTSHLADGHGADRQDGHFSRLVAVGMNSKELQANSAAHEYHVVDLNRAPVLSMLGDETVDAVFCSVSVDYLTQPLQVFREIARVLKPGGCNGSNRTHVRCSQSCSSQPETASRGCRLAVFTWSNRMFPTKAIRAWREASEPERLWICGAYFHYSGGFTAPSGKDISPYPGRSDPVYVVHAHKRAGAAHGDEL